MIYKGFRDTMLTSYAPLRLQNVTELDCVSWVVPKKKNSVQVLWVLTLDLGLRLDNLFFCKLSLNIL